MPCLLLRIPAKFCIFAVAGTYACAAVDRLIATYASGGYSRYRQSAEIVWLLASVSPYQREILVDAKLWFPLLS
jgi:hypothetical protein